MLGINNRKEAALRDLLGVAEYDSLSEYPEKATLPRPVVERAVAAVEDTEGDLRERSINFRFRAGQWRGGLALKGSGALCVKNLNETGIDIALHANNSYKFFSVLNRPHIFMHTHPDTLNGGLGKRVMDLVEEHFDPDEEDKLEFRKELARFQVPSWCDVRSFCAGIGGSVANLVSSTSGNFLLVHQNPREHSPWRTAENEHRVQGRLRQVDRVIKLVQDETPQLGQEDVLSYSLRTVTQAMVGTFACYYSSDPESLSLDRVQPGLYAGGDERQG